jgi:hypothetical protein
MTKNEYVEKLQKGVLEITFIKQSTGEVVTRTATLSPEYVPEAKPATNPSKSRAVPDDNLLFFDMDALGFRSCKIDSIIDAVEVE